MDDHKNNADEFIVFHPSQYTTVVTYDPEHDEYIASCKEVPTIQAIGKTEQLALVNFVMLTLGMD